MSRWHSPPPELYSLVEQMPGTVLLDSAGAPAGGAGCEEQWTQLFTTPLRIVMAWSAADLSALFAEIEAAAAAGLYAAGYFSYECGACFEPAAALRGFSAEPQREQPIAWFGIYERPWAFDPRTGTFPDGVPPGLEQFQAPAEEAARLRTELALSLSQYVPQIDAIQELIRAGDIYQLNFTAPIQVKGFSAAGQLYRTLRERQRAPYSAFLHGQPGQHILSFSPELFFRLDREGPHRRILTRPMKGTAARGRTKEEDESQAAWLQADAKNRAENLMIVDLLRNDLGRICRYGSIHAEDLFAVERYPTLWQMTSTVSGELREDVGFEQIFRALFPSGSITGAPKVRAMQIIAELEGRPRGVYTGAIGLFSKEQTVFNVAIRTLELSGVRGTMGVGSGIVIDSVAGDEYRECLLKAQFLTRSVETSREEFSLLESLLWKGEYPLIELHLDRLLDSASYFGFTCDRKTAQAGLEAHAAEFSDSAPRKVRLLLNADGDLHIASEKIVETDGHPLRVGIAAARTDSSDPMYFHKTTYRSLYAQALKAANKAGYDDVLFLNERGEATEGAIHNVFVEKDGRLLTPPINCGLLAGVYRRHILESNPQAEERLLTPQDLQAADAIYLSNAVRGLRQAVIHWDASPLKFPL
jgi:para-aminobenzoate synthetase/4-amino-4-deoxychorismate lyase